MATRFYFAYNTAPPVSPAMDPNTVWEHENGTTRSTLRRSVGSTALNTLGYTPDTSDHAVDNDALACQYVSGDSDTLSAQTIAAQSVKMQMQCLEGHANNNLYLTIEILVFSNDGTTLRGTLLSITRDATEMATSLTNRGLTATTSSLAVNDGDRIVVVVGAGGTPGSGSGTQGHNFSIRQGESASSGDLPEDDSTTTNTYRGWIEFANTLSFRDAQTITAGAPTVTFSAPAATAAAEATLQAGAPTVTITAPTATIDASLDKILEAGTPTTTITAPAASLATEVSILAGAPTVVTTAPPATLDSIAALLAGAPTTLITAPAATLQAEASLAAGAPTITFSAPPTTFATEVSIVAGAPTITFTAPPATLDMGGSDQILTAGAPVITFSAPAATLASEAILTAGAPTVLISAPTANLLVDQILLAGAPTITFTAPAGTYLAYGSVTGISDIDSDADEYHNGTGLMTVSVRVRVTSSPDSWVRRHGAFVFKNVTIPAGVNIYAAYIQVIWRIPDGSNVYGDLYGFAEDNAQDFTANPTITGRTKTTASTALDGWGPGAGPTSRTWHTPDIAAVVREIYERAGWTSGNNMGFVLWARTSPAVAVENYIQAYDQSGGIYKATLHILWTYGGTGDLGGTRVPLRDKSLGGQSCTRIRIFR